MKALTLWQPWAHAIVHLDKRIENRTWAPPHSAIGQPLAIHAGKKVDAGAIDDLVYDGAAPDSLYVVPLPRGAIVAIVRLERIIRSVSELPVGQGYWWQGPVGWLLNDVVPIDPIPCRGAQGLWDLQNDVENAVSKVLKQERCR